MALALAGLIGASAPAAVAAPAAGSSKSANAPSQQKPAPKRKTSTKKKKKAATAAAPAPMSFGQKLGLRKTPDALALGSSVALVADQQTGDILVSKNIDAVLPIASLTKLMTALVVIEAAQPLDDVLTISQADVDTYKGTHSRLAVGGRLSRDDLLLLALMSSENRAAAALGRNYPGGTPAFVVAMNHRARTLGMTKTRFVDATGLSSGNTSTARDLLKLTAAVYQEPLIRAYSTRESHHVRPARQPLNYVSSNRLVRGVNDWIIGLQKTGFTNEAGRCLVMQAMVQQRPLAMIFLDSTGTMTRYGDASRVRAWLQGDEARAIKVDQRRQAGDTLSHS
ncbi:MAG TPA: serine hydrolase [Solimonas sp.]